MENVIDPQVWILLYAVGVKLLSIWWPIPVIATFAYFGGKVWNKHQGAKA